MKHNMLLAAVAVVAVAPIWFGGGAGAYRKAQPI